MVGQVQLIVGPMFAGKTTELLRRLRRCRLGRQLCVLLKPSVDTRYESGAVVTHDQLRDPQCQVVRTLANAVIPKDTQVVGIDEGQFFPDLVTYCATWANDHGIVVIVAALDGTFNQEPFMQVAQLASHAELVDKIHAVCFVCGANAAFTIRKDDTCKDLVAIGGSESYEARCRLHLTQQ